VPVWTRVKFMRRSSGSGGPSSAKEFRAGVASGPEDFLISKASLGLLAGTNHGGDERRGTDQSSSCPRGVDSSHKR
jgi:hypothetical protein